MHAKYSLLLKKPDKIYKSKVELDIWNRRVDDNHKVAEKEKSALLKDYTFRGKASAFKAFLGPFLKGMKGNGPMRVTLQGVPVTTSTNTLYDVHANLITCNREGQL